MTNMVVLQRLLSTRRRIDALMRAARNAEIVRQLRAQRATYA